MALARLDVPSVMLYGGSIAPGRFRGKDVTIQDVFEAVGAHAAGNMTDEELAELERVASPGRRRLRRPVHRQHDGDRVRGARHLADGQLDGPGRGRQEGPGGRGRAAGWCMELLEQDLRPSRDHHQGRRSRTRSRASATTGGSTNAVLHLLAVANEAGVRARRSTTSTGSPGARRCSPTSSRAAASWPPTSTAPAACPLVAKRLLEAGLLNEDALTVTGRTIGEEADAAEEARGPGGGPPARRPDQAERRPRDPARQPRARRLRGEALRPRPHRAPRPGARVRVRGGRVRRGQGAADRGRRRGRDPQRGPARRARACARCSRSPRRSWARGSATRSRCSPTAASRGATHGFMAGHVAPEAPRGGPIAAVRDGDTVVFDVPNRELRRRARRRRDRRRASPPTSRRRRSTSTGVLGKYARHVGSAAEGAVTT